MKSTTEDLIRSIAVELARRLHETVGHVSILSKASSLAERSLLLPPLVSGKELMQELIAAAYSEFPVDRVQLLTVWEYIGSMVRHNGFYPSQPYHEIVSATLPMHGLATTQPRGNLADARGVLAQCLRLSHFSIPGSRFHVNKDECVLQINSKRSSRIAIAAGSITWVGGHYICRVKAEIDFEAWLHLPPRGTRTLGAETSALHQHLVREIPTIESDLHTIFQVVALLGKRAEQLICARFAIALTDNPGEAAAYAAEVAALLDVQRKLRAFK